MGNLFPFTHGSPRSRFKLYCIVLPKIALVNALFLFAYTVAVLLAVRLVLS